MRRLPIPILLLLVASSAVAEIRSRATTPNPPFVSGSTVTGTISSVSGPFIHLANGLVTIDTTGAKMTGDPPAAGSMLFAVIKSGDVAPNTPLPATHVAVTRLAQASLTGAVTLVNLAESTITVLGRTIKVTPSPKMTPLADITVNQLVHIEAENLGGVLVATSLRVLSDKPVPVPVPLPTIIRGTVRSISNTLWVINADGKDVSITVNGQTKIVGNPKVGDMVDVLITSDNVALSIIAEPQMRITGFVKSIAPTRWTVGLGPGDSKALVFVVEVNASTKMVGDPKVEDLVEVVGAIGKGSIVASSITRIQ